MIQEPGGIGRNLFGGWFGKLVLPAIILQSVLIGGGYATGREIVAYGARYGANGWLAVVAIFLGFTVMAVLTFEVARLFRAYDYKRFISQLIWKAWPAFDLLFAAMAVLIIAVMASAAANIMQETLGIPGWAGTAIIVAAVGLLLYLGAGVIEAFKSLGTGMLYVAYLIFGVLVLSRRWGQAEAVLATGDVSYLPGAGAAAAIGAGILYVGYNLAVFPAVLFALHRQTRRQETLAAGAIAGLLMTLPFGLTYLCLLGFYPDPEIMDAPVPWLRMLGTVGGGGVIAVFGIVMGWTLLETSVGLIHALIDRVDRDLAELGVGVLAGRCGLGGRARRGGLSPLQSGLLGAGILAAAALLSRVGIIALVARGYALMGYLFIALFALPLLTVGVIRIVNPGWKAELWARLPPRADAGGPGGEAPGAGGPGQDASGAASADPEVAGG